MAGPLTATTFAIRQRTPIGVNLMIIIMICMMTLFILLTAPPTRAEEHQKRLARRFIGRLSIYRSEPFFIEVMARGVDKGAAIAGLIERLGLEREDVIACGDGLNDLSMIRYAGLGVAMANAQPEVKEAADVVTLSNDEDGVAAAVERYLLNE